jgi:hypothetical protein
MAEVFAPFIIKRTIRQLTFYCMEGRNFVRKKSSLTRRRVLYAPCFKNTRHYAGLMAKASKIGSLVYNELPAYWRQGWMYRAFTGEALAMLRARKSEQEIQQVLRERYVSIVANKQPDVTKIAPPPTKRAYRKVNTTYWQSKTKKSIRRKKHQQKLMRNAGLLARASKIGSTLYHQLPKRYKRRSDYQYLTGLAFQLLKQEIDEEDILAELIPTLLSKERRSEVKVNRFGKKSDCVISHQERKYYYIVSLNKRIHALRKKERFYAYELNVP